MAAGKARGIVVGIGLNTEIGKWPCIERSFPSLHPATPNLELLGAKGKYFHNKDRNNLKQMRKME